MSFFSRLLGKQADPRDDLRDLWHQSVAVSREPHWYERGNVADTVEGRIDMIMAVLALVILRMEPSPMLGPKTAYITELFVLDMDRQLREKGVGDLMVGKNIGKLMEMLGGRLGALRDALAVGDTDPGTGNTLAERRCGAGSGIAAQYDVAERRTAIGAGGGPARAARRAGAAVG